MMTYDCRVFKFFRRSVDGKHLMSFRIETIVLKFHWRSLDRKHTGPKCDYLLQLQGT